MFSNFIPPFKDCLGLTRCLHFPLHFRVSLSVPTKDPHEILIHLQIVCCRYLEIQLILYIDLVSCNFAKCSVSYILLCGPLYRISCLFLQPLRKQVQSYFIGSLPRNYIGYILCSRSFSLSFRVTWTRI